MVWVNRNNLHRWSKTLRENVLHLCKVETCRMFMLFTKVHRRGTIFFTRYSKGTYYAKFTFFTYVLIVWLCRIDGS